MVFCGSKLVQPVVQFSVPLNAPRYGAATKNESANLPPVAADAATNNGEPAPGSYSAYAALASVKEADGVPDAEAMIRELAADQATVVRTARAVFPAADEAHDEPTADLLTQRMQVHEKTAWMLRATIA